MNKMQWASGLLISLGFLWSCNNSYNGSSNDMMAMGGWFSAFICFVTWYKTDCNLKVVFRAAYHLQTMVNKLTGFGG
jgi:hypothetical protein